MHKTMNKRLRRAMRYSECRRKGCIDFGDVDVWNFVCINKALREKKVDMGAVVKMLSP